MLAYFPKAENGETMPEPFTYERTSRKNLADREPGIIIVWQDIIFHEADLAGDKKPSKRHLWFMNHVKGLKTRWYMDSFIKKNLNIL